MKIQTLLGFNEYSLIICHDSENLYHLSIIDREHQVHNFEGIYPTLQTAIEKGKSVIHNLEYLKHNASY